MIYSIKIALVAMCYPRSRPLTRVDAVNGDSDFEPKRHQPDQYPCIWLIVAISRLSETSRRWIAWRESGRDEQVLSRGQDLCQLMLVQTRPKAACFSSDSRTDCCDAISPRSDRKDQRDQQGLGYPCIWLSPYRRHAWVYLTANANFTST